MTTPITRPMPTAGLATAIIGPTTAHTSAIMSFPNYLGKTLHLHLVAYPINKHHNTYADDDNHYRQQTGYLIRA